MTTIAMDTERGGPSLAGELGDLLVELAAGVDRARLYGPRHPAVRESAESFVARNRGRRRGRGTLSIAVAGRSLVVENRPIAQLLPGPGEVTTGCEHPLLAALADRLSAHEVATIDVAEDVTDREIAAILRFLATDPARTGRPLGREDEEALAAVPRVRVHRGEPGALWTEVSGRPAPEPPMTLGDEPEDREADARRWAAFARTALGIPRSYAERPYGAAEVATAIAARARTPDFWPPMAAEARSVAERLAQSGALGAGALGRDFSEVLRRLDDRTLRVLLSMSGEGYLRERLLGDGSAALELDVLLRLAGVAAAGDRGDEAGRLLGLLSKLERHARADSGAMGARSEAALRRQVRALVPGPDAERPGGREYEESPARALTADTTPRPTPVARSEVEAARVVALALETGAGGPTFTRALDAMIAAGRARELVGQLDLVPDSGAAEQAWRRLCDRPVLVRLLHEEQPDWEVLDRILPRAGLVAARPLVDRLTAADGTEFRDRLLDRLAGLASGSRSRHPGRIPLDDDGARALAAARPARPACRLRAEPAAPPLRFDLDAEIEAVHWLHEEAGRRGVVPVAEASTVVQLLSVAMHSESQVVLPRVRLDSVGRYETLHAINVACLAMALAEHLRYATSDVHAIGEAALLHDVGKTRTPRSILDKQGALDADEWTVIRRHPADGARILLASGPRMELAAVVAHEHHVGWRGTGYPELAVPRRAHPVSRLVQVCDVYDALRTRRPYRPPWSRVRAVRYLATRAGEELDPEIVGAFLEMIEQCQPRTVPLDREADATDAA